MIELLKRLQRIHIELNNGIRSIVYLNQRKEDFVTICIKPSCILVRFADKKDINKSVVDIQLSCDGICDVITSNKPKDIRNFQLSHNVISAKNYLLEKRYDILEALEEITKKN